MGNGIHSKKPNQINKAIAENPSMTCAQAGKENHRLKIVRLDFCARMLASQLPITTLITTRWTSSVRSSRISRRTG